MIRSYDKGLGKTPRFFLRLQAVESSVKQDPRISDPLPRWWHPRAVYVHVPFCAHHCCYCDFAVVAGRDELAERYLDALEKEMECGLPRLTPPGSPALVESVFIGGGTPSHLTVGQLARLLTMIQIG